MNQDNRWRNYGLWLSIAAFVPLLLSSLGIHLVPNYQEIVNAFLAILVAAGIISNPTTTAKWFYDDPDENKENTHETNKEDKK